MFKHWGEGRIKVRFTEAEVFGLIQLISVLLHYNYSGLSLMERLQLEKSIELNGQPRGVQSRWKSWPNGPEMCSLWGLCCWMPPVRQSRDELSMYSHPLAGCLREDSLLSDLAQFPF